MLTPYPGYNRLMLVHGTVIHTPDKGEVEILEGAAIVVDTAVTDSDFVTWEALDTIDDLLQKIIYSVSRRNITTVWINGKRVKD